MDNSEKKLNLLSLSYSRYVSRAHTTFSCWVELIIGVTIGFFGTIFAYIQLLGIKPDFYKILSLIEFSFIIAGIISVVTFVIIYNSRAERKDIVKKIKALRCSQSN